MLVKFTSVHWSKNVLCLKGFKIFGVFVVRATHFSKVIDYWLMIVLWILAMSYMTHRKTWSTSKIFTIFSLYHYKNVHRRGNIVKNTWETVKKETQFALASCLMCYFIWNLEILAMAWFSPRFTNDDPLIFPPKKYQSEFQMFTKGKKIIGVMHT